MTIHPFANMRGSRFHLSTFALSLLLGLASGVTARAVEQWEHADVVLRVPSGGNPYVDVQLRARFTQADRTIEVLGFWDGDDVYKIRFSPPAAGTWQYVTSSNRPELDGQTGSLTVAPPAAGNRGPVEVFKTYYFRHADGTPYHQFGTTCYAWIHQPEAMQQQTLETLAASPFNKIRFCVFPKSYTYNRNEPERFAFVRKADGKFDFTRPDPLYWRHLEQRIIDLQRLGIEADLILWHPYDRWGFAEMGAANDDRYLRYCIARLGGFRNVWWSLANEFDLMAPGAMANHRGDKQMADWDRFFQILQNEDGHQRLRGIHNCRGFYDHSKPWVTHSSIQRHDVHRVPEWREQYKRPVVIDECGYEGDVPQGWGNLKPEEMVRRFWIGTMGGGYVGHGETYQHPEDLLWWSKGGVLHGTSPQRIAWLKQLMADSPPFDELHPTREENDRFLLAKPGAYYLVYCQKPGTGTIELAGDRPYKLDRLDPWAMTVAPLGTATAGRFTLVSPRSDLVFRLTPYQAGEPLRPEARITASVTEGQPPLSVEFTGTGGERMRWDFGDGSTSDLASPQHVFQQPGLYCVTLTVTDARGGVGQSVVDIAVDRDSAEPIVRAGFEQGEKPAFKLHGTARRGAGGALRFPDGQPWGWARGEDRATDDLRGLRSFTILGWVKPESWQIGSGGNRIVFCLNKDRSGIDLVCHADGRLRLAVNQWPDSVRNDSSPGRLVVGRWTFFAVTYDATQPRDNVSWYFSEPRDAPGPTAVQLDRKTTYTAGSVAADPGPLAIGNFNETMRSYGLDRQFRGEIRGLQIFGSRISGRGAQSLETISGNQ
jgi:PKD repeat protein